MLFLFDYDGVIADSFAFLLETCIEAQSALGEGRAPTSEDFRTIQNLTFDGLARMIGIPECKCAAYAEKVFEIQQKGCQVPAFPGVVEAIRELAVRHTVAVVTNSQSQSVASALDVFGIGPAVAAVKGGESGISKRDRILHLQDGYACLDEPTYMIGDTVGDMCAGKQAGVRTVAVTWGFQARELLARESPDYLIDHPKEMLAIAGGRMRRGTDR